MKPIDIVAIYHKENIIRHLTWIESLLEAGECKTLVDMLPVVENGEYMIVASRNFTTQNYIITCSSEKETKDLYVSPTFLAFQVSGKEGVKKTEVRFDKDLGKAVDSFLNRYRERFSR